MRKLISIVTIMFLFVLFISIARAQSIFDVTDDGAKDNGADINPALTSAWKKACASSNPSKVLVPKGIFSLSPITFEGPCLAPIEVSVQGTLKALTGAGKMTKSGGWVTFQHIEGFTLSGGGTFDGQGASTWGTCGNDFCKQLPINIRFDFITNGMVHDVTSLNSKQFHVNVLGCKNFKFLGFTVTAPADSRNTDGIHIGVSDGITIADSTIGTGDDCISIGSGTRNTTITNVKCGPGHGFSIGSLGKYKDEEPVVGVIVKGCTLTNTDNGARIKTWPASYESSASDIHFEDITMVNVTNPIIIDQQYCPYDECNAKVPSRVKISRVSFTNIRGTSASPVAVKLACSSGIPCEGVELVGVDLKYTGNEGTITSECSNVKPKISAVQDALACASPIGAPTKKA